MKLPSIVIALVLVASTLGSSTETEQSYRYVRWSGLEQITIEEPVEPNAQGRIVVANDASFQTSFCEADSEYYCFFSAHQAFAVPKSIAGNTDEWTVKGVRFELVERDVSVSIFGRRIDGLVVIRSPADATVAGDKPWLYLYSPRAGLVAFGSEDLRVTYWLEGEHGFGGSDQKKQSLTPVDNSPCRSSGPSPVAEWSVHGDLLRGTRISARVRTAH